MDCAEVLKIVLVGRSTVRVFGRIDTTAQPCISLEITVEFPSGDLTETAVVSGNNWTADFSSISEADLKLWCDRQRFPNPFTVKMVCRGSEGGILCDPTGSQYLTCPCCPTIENQDFKIGLCQDSEDGPVRLVTWTLKVHWSPDCTETAEIKLETWHPSNPAISTGENTVPAVRPVMPPADFLLIHPQVWLPADRDYQGKITVIAPVECNNEPQEVARFHIPACDNELPDPPRCIPVPEDYALIVFDDKGQHVGADDCVNGAYARVEAPAHEGPVQWTVDGSPGTAESGNPRAIRVSLDRDRQRTVAAQVGRGECRKDVTRTITRCPPKPPRVSLCMILLIGSLALLLGGTALYSGGLAGMGFVGCYAALNIYAVIIFAVFFVITIFAAFCMMVGAIGLVLWFIFCGRCAGLPFKISTCETLKAIHQILQWVSAGFWIVEAAIAFGASFATFCPPFIAWIFNGLAMLTNSTVLLTINFLFEYYGNAVGCFNSWRWVPRLPAVILNAPCLDEIGSGKSEN